MKSRPRRQPSDNVEITKQRIGNDKPLMRISTLTEPITSSLVSLAAHRRDCWPCCRGSIMRLLAEQILDEHNEYGDPLSIKQRVK